MRFMSVLLAMLNKINAMHILEWTKAKNNFKIKVKYVTTIKHKNKVKQ